MRSLISILDFTTEELDQLISTAKDIAKIMAYAMKNTHCASFLSALSYTDEEGGLIYHKPLVTSLMSLQALHNQHREQEL